MTISTQKTSLFFRISISITVFGALLQYISWPIIVLGSLGMIVFHSIDFFQKPKKTALDYARQILIVVFSTNYILSLFQLPFSNLFILLTKVSLIVFLAIYLKQIIHSMQNLTQNNLLLVSTGTDKLSNLLADLATVYIVLASLFIILQWEFGVFNAQILLVIGLLTALVSIITSSRKIES